MFLLTKTSVLLLISSKFQTKLLKQPLLRRQLLKCYSVNATSKKNQPSVQQPLVEQLNTPPSKDFCYSRYPVSNGLSDKGSCGDPIEDCFSSNYRARNCFIKSPNVVVLNQNTDGQILSLFSAYSYARLQYTISLLAALSKLRLTGLVVSTTLAGCALAAPTQFACEAFLNHPVFSMVILAIGTGLTSGAASSVNQIMEIQHDRRMKRTQNRPLVQNLISPINAGIFSIVSLFSGVSLLYAFINPLVATLGTLNFFLYTCIYTPLKRLTHWNTWVGSLVGAIPPLMGWATASGGLEWGSLMLAALLYSWQFPHFMALSWNLRNDYARAGFQMTSNVNPDLCKRTALRHSIITTFICLGGAGCKAVSLGPWAGWSLGLGSLPVNLALIYYAWHFYKASPTASAAAARNLFRASLVHLPVVMTAMLICTHWSSAPCI